MRTCVVGVWWMQALAPRKTREAYRLCADALVFLLLPRMLHLLHDVHACLERRDHLIIVRRMPLSGFEHEICNSFKS